MKLRIALTAAFLALVGVVGWLSMASAAKAPTPVLVYGDSLMKEASSTINAVTATSPDPATAVGMAGRSPCDFLKEATGAFNKVVAHQLVHYNLFVIETAGNSNTTCMREPGSKHDMTIASAEWEAKYRTDLNALVSLAESKGTPVLFVSPPPFAGISTPRNDIYTTVEPQLKIDHPEVTFTDGPRLAVSNDGAFTSTMPCLASETAADGCSNGMITIRSPFDDLHFCPTGFHNNIKVTGCSVYDGGAVRFGQAIADAIATFEQSAQAAKP